MSRQEGGTELLENDKGTTELLENYLCAIRQEYPFINPVEIIPCRHLFDKQALDAALQAQPYTCPCCRGPLESKHPLSYRDMANFAHFLSENPEYYQDVHFDLDRFSDIVEQNKLKDDPIGKRFLTVLAHATNHLNNAIEILASTLMGRDLLRQKLSVESETGKYFFGKAELSTESLETQINGRSIRDWLNMSTEREHKLTKIREARERMCAQARLFASLGAGSAADVNSLLQQLVYGEESKVKEKLESVKDNAAQLSELLEKTGTVKDYSGRTITGMTLLQAAAAAGDVEMCQMLKDYMAPDEFTAQLVELFPDGIDAHDAAQQREVFNFDTVIEAITRATPAELDKALNKEGAQFTQTDSARVKSDDQLTLVEALNRFREQFSTCSINEKIFNPHHLLRAYDAYNQFFGQCERDGSDTGFIKRELCCRQIVGYVQRFVPACYAQAYIQGLFNLVRPRYRPSDWQPRALERNLKFKVNDGSYFSADPSSSSVRLGLVQGLGFDCAFAYVGLYGQLHMSVGVSHVRGCSFSKSYVQQKQQAFRVLYGSSALNRTLVRKTVV